MDVAIDIKRRLVRYGLTPVTTLWEVKNEVFLCDIPGYFMKVNQITVHCQHQLFHNGIYKYIYIYIFDRDFYMIGIFVVKELKILEQGPLLPFRNSRNDL